MDQKATIKALHEKWKKKRRQFLFWKIRNIAMVMIALTCAVALIKGDIEHMQTQKEAEQETPHTYATPQPVSMRMTELEEKDLPMVEAPQVVTEEIPEEIPEEVPAETIEEAPVEMPEECHEDHENEKIEAALLAKANRMDEVRITHYCSELYPHICGTGSGITASGREIQPYLSVAVDPKVIPLGSEVMIDYGDGEIHYYRADDVGAWVNGAHVDVAVTTHDEALQLGIKTATVWWIAPEKGGE